MCRYCNICFVLTIACLMFSGHAKGQDLETIDVVRTIHGSVWKGTILTWDTAGVVEFQSLSGIKRTFQEEQIRSVKQKILNKSRNERPYNFPDEGVYNVLDAGISAGDDIYLGLTYAVGHRFSRWLSVGGGAGYESFQVGEKRTIIPLFTEVRGFLREAHVSPYYAMRLGYGIALKDDQSDLTKARGGIMINPQMGVRFSGNENLNLFAGFGIHIQKAEYIIDWGGGERVVDRYWYRRAEIKFGMMF